jgi:2-haloacid dehalogenase
MTERAVVFDLGGVLIDWDPRHLYRQLFDDEQQMEWFLANVTTREWNLLQDRGRSLSAATDELLARHPQYEALIRAYYDRWPEMLGGTIDDNVATLAELHASGIPLYALSNWSAETFAAARGSLPFLDWFAGVIISGQEGMAKPDEQIFVLLLQRFELKPASTTFVDDSMANVEQARRLGIDAIHYTVPAALRGALAGRGLLPAHPSHGTPSKRYAE